MPKPWPFNRICEPTPADWGTKMTVCLVSHSFRENTFVSVTDSMLSMADMSADKLATKNFSIGSSWMCMFSAGDMSPVVAISNNVRSQLNGDCSVQQVIAAFQSSFRKELVSKAESSILAPFDMTMADFRTNGLTNFGPEIFSRMFYQIDQLSAEVTFLVYGFEEEKPHIFTIQNKGEISHFDQPGFWAIGSGQTSALGSLFSLGGYSITVRTLEDVLYLLCKAKFNAESATGVGQHTTAFILRSDRSRFFIFNDEIEKLKTVWKSNRPQPVPPGADTLARKITDKAEEKAKNIKKVKELSK